MKCDFCGKKARHRCDSFYAANSPSAKPTANTRRVGEWLFCEAAVCDRCKTVRIAQVGTGYCPAYHCPDHKADAA